jgi:transcriptional regulator with XRE-family HTH domain
LGERLRLARLRRRYSAESVAVRAGITRVTLARVEKGDAGTSMGAYVAVLRVLGLQGDLDALGRDDALGRKLQDLGMSVGRTAPRRRTGKPLLASESSDRQAAGPEKRM